MDTQFPIGLSVVIPNYKEPNVDELKEKVDTVLRQDPRIKWWDIHVVTDFSGRGYGHTLKRGFNIARHDYVLIMDADLTYSPFDIHRLIDEIPFADMVVGERRGTVTASGFIRSCGRAIVKSYARWRTGYPIADINSGFRIIRRNVIDEFKHLFPNKFSLTTTLTMACYSVGYRVRYVPVFYARRYGKSSMKPWEFFRFLWKIESLKKRLKSKTR
jgi:glycosyltransferase involved in cell wall biosynthesis